jgi:hypothetical protein
MLIKIENKEQLKNLINATNGSKQIQWKDDKNKTVKRRISISTLGSLMVLWEKSRTRGIEYETEITKLINEGLLYFVYQNQTIKEELTPAQKYISDLKKWEKAIEKNRHPNIWNNLLNENNKLTQEKEQILLNNPDIKTHFDAWDKAKEIGINRITEYKTTTLNTWKIPEYYKIAIKDALDNKKKYRCEWHNKYDCKVEINATPEVQRAWFSLEYRGMLNGHYYMLLNDNTALYLEDD